MLASFPAGLHLHICPEGQIWNQDHKPQDHLQEPSCVNKQCATQNRHWRQLIIDVLLDECYVHDGWGEAQLDVTPRQSINKSASGSNNNKALHLRNVLQCSSHLRESGNLYFWSCVESVVVVRGNIRARGGQSWPRVLPSSTQGEALRWFDSDVKERETTQRPISAFESSKCRCSSIVMPSKAKMV